MNKLLNVGLSPAKILLPKNDFEKWAVVACDQYTSQREYWERVEEFTSNSPSALNLILPEAYLEDDDVETKQNLVNVTMAKYLEEDVFQEEYDGLIYIERQVDKGYRKGLIACVDLDQYDYHKGSKSLIRSTEGTIEDRLPPRVKIRMEAKLELPHIMVLIDDEENIVFDDIAKNIDVENPLYDFNLMENSGNIKGFAVKESAYDALADNLEVLKNKNDGFLFAMGDGNHSLATAKQCWENIKENLSEDEQKDHLARFALVEIVNLHDETLDFESIHRLLINNKEFQLDEIAQFIGLGNDALPYYRNGGQGMLLIDSEDKLCAAVVQKGLDAYMEKYPEVKIDYIHGDDVAYKLSMQDNVISFILPAFDKKALFKTVIEDGALPRKSFSMGHAHEKRFYLEARKITKD